MRDGGERRGQIDAAQAHRRRVRARRGARPLGASVKLGYFAQHAMEILDEPKRAGTPCGTTLVSALSAGFGGIAAHAGGVFGFSGDDIEKPCRICRGARRRGSCLAKMLYDPPNFLVLDEPTNHLDMATKDMLIEALGNFDGTMLFVSHDRRFLVGALEPGARARPSRSPSLWRWLQRIRGRERARSPRHPRLTVADSERRSLSRALPRAARRGACMAG